LITTFALAGEVHPAALVTVKVYVVLAVKPVTVVVVVIVGGGVVGILAGVSLPLSVQLFTDQFAIPISMWSVAIAFGVSALVGLVFGLLPANRASRLNPTEALRYE